MSGAASAVRAIGSPIAAMLVAVVIGMQPAHANDRKTFPGSSCQGWGNVDAEIAATDGGGVLNASFTSAYTVSCPVVRDNTTNTNGAADVLVYGNRDGSTATALSCIFKVTRASDGRDYYSLTRSTPASGNVTLTIPVTSSVSGGFYNLLCVLPPRSKIHGYVLSEY